MDGRGLWQLGDEELLAALRESQARLCRAYGEQLTLLGELLVRNLAPAVGYRTAARLVQDLLRIGQSEANRRLAHATAITAAPALSGAELPAVLPATAKAVRAGAVGAEQVEAIRRVITGLPAGIPVEDQERAERTLVEAAYTVGPAAIAKLGRALHGCLDQDGRPPTAEPSRRSVNELHWVTRGTGELELKGRLAAEGAALLASVLGPLAKPRPALDGEPDPRTRAGRYGDALTDALRLAANSGELPADGGERPTLVVTVTLDALRERLPSAPPRDPGTPPTSDPTPPVIGEPVVALLGDGMLVAARTARRLACDSAIIPAVLNGRSEPLDIGRKTRTVPAAMRRALVLRDRGCAFPGCTMPASWCDAHHRQHWADGGPTALPNLVLLCRIHHDLIHNSAWQVQLPDGVPEFIPPPYIDPDQAPRRNPVHPGVADL